jgi:hypothetical protein
VVKGDCPSIAICGAGVWAESNSRALETVVAVDALRIASFI